LKIIFFVSYFIFSYNFEYQYINLKNSKKNVLYTGFEPLLALLVKVAHTLFFLPICDFAPGFHRRGCSLSDVRRWFGWVMWSPWVCGRWVSVRVRL